MLLFMLYRMTPPRQPRRSCGSVSALQAATIITVAALIVTLVVLGNPLLLVAGVTVVLLGLVLGVPLPQSLQHVLLGQPAGGVA